MKLIVVSSTESLATEIIKQALSHPRIISVVAIARHPIDINTTRFESVVLQNFEDWTPAGAAIYGSDACIWYVDIWWIRTFHYGAVARDNGHRRTVGVTPSESLNTSPEEARRICLDYTMAGMERMLEMWREYSESPVFTSEYPFRFIYMSAANAERDRGKKPWVLGDLCLLKVRFSLSRSFEDSQMVVLIIHLQGETETRVLDFARGLDGIMKACVAKPGHIVPTAGNVLQGIKSGLSTIRAKLVGVPKIHVSEIAASLVALAVHGCKVDTLSHEDLVTLGRELLGRT
ncbi:hypothetical protein OCU04_012110 [Sclerotinia nivalis]|uniref:Uncharacterized protein n=1 Tax=Sclerotinia nivalis TaxID=352851 RepID=A0A9X0AA92_9HELO|nr:hypothetical protein OCU04_012110 [Sclerotinia nivalis]